MGVGKTTVGKILAKRKGLNFVDFDEKIVEDTGMSIQEYFDKYGEEAFRKLEHENLKELVKEKSVISTGGGIVLREANREILKKTNPVIYLKADHDVYYQRLKEDTISRPIIVSKTQDEVIDIYESRIKFYEECSTICVDTSALSPEEVADIVLAHVDDQREITA